MKKFKYTVFSTKDNNYLYDGVSGNIFNIQESIFNNHKELFENIQNETYLLGSNLASDYEEILEAIKNSYIIQSSRNPFEYWFDLDNYKKNFYTEINHLMIGITEKCNLRCKYCIYGGHYKNERVHSETNIKFETLKQSIDYFFKISKSNKKVINLYGGEPFMNIRDMKRIVDYIDKIDDTVQIYITTNGVLLTESVMEWFKSKKNINLFISLAGIPERHDELRVLINNKPTYNIIKKNLLYLKNLDPVAYSERINFVFNLFDEVQLIELQEFWEQDELFKDIKRKPEITFIDCSDDDGFVKKLGDSIIENYPKNINPLYEYIRLLKNKKYDNLIVQHFDNKLLHIHKRQIGSNQNILSGVCRPFIHKMFVDVHGNINICENFVYGNKFSNVNDEFSLNSVEQLLSIYKNERNKTCSDCWAIKLCSLCFRDIIDRDGEINYSRSNKLCEYERKAITEMLTEYCSILEEDDSLLDHLDEYIIHS